MLIIRVGVHDASPFFKVSREKKIKQNREQVETSQYTYIRICIHMHPGRLEGKKTKSPNPSLQTKYRC